MAQYVHPVLYRGNNPSYRAGIVDLTGKSLDDLFNIPQGSTFDKLEITDLDTFFKKLQASEKVRESLGIPRMNYLAYSFDAFGWGKVPQIIKLVEKCRSLDYEVRCWLNEESAMLVVCAATFDTSEDSGWELYEWANIHNECPSDSYGHASWFEFCLFGVPIYDNWRLEERNGRFVAVSPDETRVAFFG